jgi:hypothetical protein
MDIGIGKILFNFGIFVNRISDSIYKKYKCACSVLDFFMSFLLIPE